MTLDGVEFWRVAAPLVNSKAKSLACILPLPPAELKIGSLKVTVAVRLSPERVEAMIFGGVFSFKVTFKSDEVAATFPSTSKIASPTAETVTTSVPSGRPFRERPNS